MKLVIKLLKQGRVVSTAEGRINVPVDDAFVNDVWRAEAAINKTSIRAHISIEEEEA